jgi:hypothetical protein
LGIDVGVDISSGNGIEEFYDYIGYMSFWLGVFNSSVLVGLGRMVSRVEEWKKNGRKWKNW